MSGSVHRLNKAWAQRILPLCLCGFVGIALVVPVAVPASAQSNDVLNRIKRIENDVDTLNRAVYKGEKPPTPIADGASGEADALLQNRMNQIEKDVRALTGKFEEQDHATRQLQQKIDMLEARLNAPQPQAAATNPAIQQPMNNTDTNVIPPTMADGTPAVIAPSPVAADDPALNVTGAETGAAATDAAGLYEQGFGQIKAQQYPQAETSFSEFIKKYPTHALAPNALYWLGETYYVRGEFDKASRTFAEAYQKYPNGPKGADNLLKLGLSLAGKGEKDNACLALGQLKKEYPKGPEPVLKRGEQEMKTLGCP